ncbi:MAG: hypothetical protein Unbinned4336contig1000_5 [Prokaryotic dsDNA virus sp.]|nr:MAG: hypothetical protein Unbinned4336contig1000_5 [Prokaryotic dsDNA virus sp.]|tara:strand:- start:40147 stop:40500 length:354 start_codon:yes stop_codon:yes gene_type:complete
MIAAITAIGGLVKSWLDRKAKEQVAKADAYAQRKNIEATYDNIALQNMKFSMKDEFLLVIIWAPIVLAWFDEERASAWVAFIGELPVYYQVLLFGTVASVFGLRWLISRQIKQVLTK